MSRYCILTCPWPYKEPNHVHCTLYSVQHRSVTFLPQSVQDSIHFKDKLMYIYTSGTTGMPKVRITCLPQLFRPPSLIAPPLLPPSMIAPSLLPPSMIAPSLLPPSMIAPPLLDQSLITSHFLPPGCCNQARPLHPCWWWAYHHDRSGVHC